MSYFICPECYYTTDDVTKEACERCYTKLLRECPICEKPILKDNVIFCSECGSKMRLSYVPIQQKMWKHRSVLFGIIVFT